MINKLGAKILALFFVFSVLGLLSLKSGLNSVYDYPENITVEEARLALGGTQLAHYIAVADPEKVQIGKDLVEKGRTKRGIFKSKVISPYFVCTDCHNLGREFKNANEESPEKRLEYAKENGLPYLPASTFWGIYNRTDFYNHDYVKKYGDLISTAKKSLPESIQVCAKYCSAGRNLKDWELEAILHYFKELELTLKDVNLTDQQRSDIANAGALKSEAKKELLKILEDSYIKAYSAYFDETMPREKRKYGVGGNIENGKFIFENACLYCHKDGRVTYLTLESDKLTGRMFVNHMEGYSDKSIYQIVRWGTHTMPGRNQYMPRYTKNKMSDEQLEDLMAYIRQLAEK